MNNLLLGIISRPHESPRSRHHNRRICGHPGSSIFFFFKELNRPKTLNRKGLSWMDSWYSEQNLQALLWQTWSSEEHLSSHTGLAFHLLFAKFFLIWALMDSWMFLSRAVSPAILTKHTNEQTHTVSVAALHPTEPKKNHWNIRAEEGKVSTRGAAEPAHRCTDCWRPSPSGAWWSL